ncbi:MAG: hypothetical protein M3R59_08150 [Verrucomicrobiota bacterium]|nr:hypothetical protein [Verrucomicrobiota bacterium]
MSFRSQVVSLRRLLEEKLQSVPPLKKYPLPNAAFQQQICEYYGALNPTAIERAVSAYYDDARLAIIVDPASNYCPLTCVWTSTAQDGPSFTFPKLSPGRVLNTFIERWLACFPLFLALDKPGSPEGRILINFNDAGIDPGLAFSACGNEFTLIPDSVFLSELGYEKARTYFDERQIPWKKRKDVVLWRGSSLGQKDNAILEMPRARLCQIAKAANADWLDIGLVDLFEISEADTTCLIAGGLTKERVPWKKLSQYRFHIDIDGHANSFAGLFRKLLSGGLVLKVGSPNGFAQWYYDRLKPWHNYVPVRCDMSDLLEVASYCRTHQATSRRIAQRGRQLALSMIFASEFKRMVETTQRAFARNRGVISRPLV